LATSGPGLGSALVSPLAHSHLGSIETCSQTEG
jgi:nitrogen-specific signal transduction histidine kinase